MASDEGEYISGAVTELSNEAQSYLPQIKIKTPVQQHNLMSPKRSHDASFISSTTPKIKVQNADENDIQTKQEIGLDETTIPYFKRKKYVEHVEKMRQLTDNSKRSLSPRLSKQELSIRKQTRKTSVVLESIKNRYI